MSNTLSDEILHKTFEYRDGVLYWKWKSTKCNHTRVVGKPCGTVHRSGYIYLSVDNKKFMAHRVIYAMHTGQWPKQVDHIDGNPLNNLISNLRSANNGENNCNRRKKQNENYISQYKGVSKRTYGKWFAQIAHKKKRYFLGEFHDEHHAAHAYNKAAISLFGDFAILNPVGIESSQHKEGSGS